MIKAIATDLDGTLFYPRKKIGLISKPNKQFIQNAISNGKEIILVTGRNYNTAKKVEKAVGMEKSISIVGCNGAIISHNGEIVSETYIPKDEALAIYKELRSNKQIWTIMIFTSDCVMLVDACGLNPFLTAVGWIGLNIQGAYSEPYILGEKKVRKHLEKEDVKVYKIMPWFGPGKKADNKAKEASIEWSKKYADKFEFCWSIDAVEIMEKGVSKAGALSQLLKSLNINNDEVAVVGDSGNDISLFKAYENSFVMEQAPDEVKKEAKTVVKSVAELESYIK